MKENHQKELQEMEVDKITLFSTDLILHQFDLCIIAKLDKNLQMCS